MLTDHPSEPVGNLLQVLTFLQVQQLAVPRCPPLRGARLEEAPQGQDQEGGGGTGFVRGEEGLFFQKSNITSQQWTNTSIHMKKL